MELKINSRHVTLTEDMKSYAVKRLGKLDRRFRESVPVNLLIRHEDTKREDDRYIAEVTIRLRRGVIRGEERGATPRVAIDAVEENIDRKIRRYKTRLSRRRRSAMKLEAGIGGELVDQGHEPDGDVVELSGGALVRTKSHVVESMGVEEAAARMELLGHSFFLFLNSETGSHNVVYRRRDNNYGLIVPGESVAG